MSLNVCIFGVSGYTGSKLLYLLSKHRKVNIKGVFGKKSINYSLPDLFPNIDNLPNIKITNYKDFNFDSIDIVFSCLPHGKFQEEVFLKLDKKLSVIDLSGDFRLQNISEYENWYNLTHKSKKYLKSFIYGLTEIYKKDILKAKYVSNPGCYPTSILIPLIPLLKSKVLGDGHVVIDSKSGVSGAGKKPKVQNLFAEISENFFSYGVSKHRHYPEICQEIKKYNDKVSLTFTPHLLPLISGLQSTIYIDKKNFDKNDLKQILKKFYKGEQFVKLYSDNRIPEIREVKNTNDIAIQILNDYSKKKDNYYKLH